MIPPKRLRRTLFTMQACSEVFTIKYVSLFHKSSQELSISNCASKQLLQFSAVLFLFFFSFFLFFFLFLCFYFVLLSGKKTL